MNNADPTPSSDTPPDAPCTGYEAPRLEAVGNLRELLGKSGTMPESEKGHGVDRKP